MQLASVASADGGFSMGLRACACVKVMHGA
jgi:hypothetical protein